VYIRNLGIFYTIANDFKGLQNQFFGLQPDQLDPRSHRHAVVLQGERVLPGGMLLLVHGDGRLTRTGQRKEFGPRTPKETGKDTFLAYHFYQESICIVKTVEIDTFSKLWFSKILINILSSFT
jgi:hypothetical protein